jgi:putative PIN family toxin of toxin-antitoxin system
MNVVVDANVIISAVLKPGSTPDRALSLVRSRDQMCFSAATLAELHDVLTRPRIATLAAQADIPFFLTALRNEAHVFAPGQVVRECRDPADDKYLELALEARASAIITGDRDLLVLDPWRGIRIVTPGAFLELAAG